MSSGGSGTQPGTGFTGGRLDAATMAAKLAAAREKNRLAQQRFRERQRVRQKEAGEQCEVLQEQIEEVSSWFGAARVRLSASSGCSCLAATAV
jgi:hypothetical protein